MSKHIRKPKIANGDHREQHLALVAAHFKLSGPAEVAERQAGHTLDYRTHFERRVRLSQQPVYRAEFRKL